VDVAPKIHVHLSPSALHVALAKQKMILLCDRSHEG
jgi:hypothetical protein